MQPLALAVTFLATIVTANILTTRYGMIPVGFGYASTAGTYLAGLVFVLRDSIQDVSGRWFAVLLVTIGAVVSYLVADPFIALASGVAFLVSELADFLIYTPLREHGYIRAATASNTVGAVIDTFLFLWIAGFPIVGAWQGQLIGKLTVTVLTVALVVGFRAVSRKPVR